MNEASRRQILSDMGIVPWLLRTAPGQAAPARDASQQTSGSAPVPRTAPAAAPAPVPEPAPRTRATADVARPEPLAAGQQPAPTERQSAADAETATPLSAVALALPGAVLLVDGSSTRRDLRLARDLLAAAGGDWRSRPASRRFDWPPAGAEDAVAVTAEALRRAFAAFVDKDLTDHGAVLLLCTESLAEHLPDGTLAPLVVPDLEVLGRDPEAKRELWRELRARAAKSPA